MADASGLPLHEESSNSLLPEKRKKGEYYGRDDVSFTTMPSSQVILIRVLEWCTGNQASEVWQEEAEGCVCSCQHVCWVV
jgi:hypothetical protein